MLTLSAVISLAASARCAEPLRFRGTVKLGQPYRYRVDSGLIFGLEPTLPKQSGCDGWRVWIGTSEGKNFADIATGPLHGLSNLDICASDFRNSDNSGPNQTGPKNVNRPGKLREFRFVTTRAENERLRGALMNIATLTELLRRVNRGSLRIVRLSLGQLKSGSQPTIEQIDFLVELDIRPVRVADDQP
jgi:hypothetical protein